MSFDLDDFGEAQVHPCSECPRCRCGKVFRYLHELLDHARQYGTIGKRTGFLILSLEHLSDRFPYPMPKSHSCGCEHCLSLAVTFGCKPRSITAP